MLKNYIALMLLLKNYTAKAYIFFTVISGVGITVSKLPTQAQFTIDMRTKRNIEQALLKITEDYRGFCIETHNFLPDNKKFSLVKDLIRQRITQLEHFINEEKRLQGEKQADYENL